MATVAGPGPQLGIVVAPAGKEVWVTAVDSARVVVLDGAKAGVIATFPSGGKHPTRARFSPDGRLAAVTHPEAKLVSIVDLGRRAVVRTIALPTTPDGVAYVASVSADPASLDEGGAEP